MTLLKKAFFAISILVCSISFGQTDTKTYRELPKPAQLIKGTTPTQVEVVELFSYTCPHCYKLDEPLEKWLKNKKSDDIVFVRLQTPGEGIWDLLSKTYFTLEAMNKVDKGHPKMFDAVMKKRMKFESKEDIAKYLNKEIAINEADFLKTWDSFTVTANYDRAKDVIYNQYRIDYTPVFIIDGKYIIDGESAKATSYEGIVEAVDKFANRLIDQKKANAK